jgi:hypothetical protein
MGGAAAAARRLRAELQGCGAGRTRSLGG